VKAVNVRLLIHGIVRQTTVLIAQLATAGGVRAPLAELANQIFLDLTAELEAQGVSRKVSADMFGMALRAYQKKIQRLSESSTVQGRSLWEAVLEHFEPDHVFSRGDVLQRFRNDDDALVRGVLHDLVETGLISCSGSGLDAVYRKTSQEERTLLVRNGRGLEEFLWLLVYREGPLSTDDLARTSGLKAEQLSVPIARLLSEGRVTELDGRWKAHGFVVALGAEAGWEAAMFDHYQALVRTLCARLRPLGEPSTSSQETGGSTFTMLVWDGHPLDAEVRSTLQRVRAELGALRNKVAAYNLNQPDRAKVRSVSFYAGQCVTEDSSEREEQS
jgi:hypothetical protein